MCVCAIAHTRKTCNGSAAPGQGNTASGGLFCTIVPVVGDQQSHTAHTQSTQPPPITNQFVFLLPLDDDDDGNAANGLVPANMSRTQKKKEPHTSKNEKPILSKYAIWYISL